MAGSPPAELRHITSATNLTPSRERKVSNRNSQHIRTHRLGSRSPASIPSSPTSIHSSSSAIFERDVEPLTPSPAVSHPDPHRMARGKLTESLEQAIPSVLDSAAEVLASAGGDDDELDAISIVAPMPFDGYQSGFTSPISRMSSRSPSPNGADHRRSLLFSASPMSGSPPTRPTVQTSIVPPLAIAPTVPATTATTATPTSAYFSVTSEAGSEASSPTTATHTEHPLHTLSPALPHAPPPSQATITLSSTASSHPPSPAHASKRLSFLSYMDILSSAPTTALSLSSLTSAPEPPPHLPSVLGVPQAQAAGGHSSAGSVHSPTFERDAAAGIVDDVGGEWEREGLGRGLEERLEALNTLPVSVPGRA
ncbi:hypothetical protein OBBRIDRAFT_357616 [Obba rivulosa]|uniref:Uncharacterized protein n=1 Tax=Obba rivulosa TaxID=1052685 RepID=A0A8E2AQI6_9APHY|nr:hypothetical protein OBBRIDRAFT_357616 [Obba rivulosa]